ncbi:protein phosphatase 1 regulatory subunit 32 isoform X6 [Aquila chrysaetos chrysaetos]|uniref:protein phosphatase 1 regulatory subunit 32 isoform X6 n=1 Tax=Aquila chrysaetos chrysaetos TaxID=223781 RepID=UPI001B7D47F8|nr:protein phosphatase 1 regulatory subunit 32 isoform X6 [Aquila chrysaetos chrysaetos]XP_040985075.1 protein phosphatase 1 regulatory subunit 32 isoform X6 [Aquila chrysaetos chrysaetos]
MTKPPLPAVTQASHVSVPALATTPAAATCPTTTRPSPACSARAVQQRATARTPPRPPPLSTSSPFGSLTAGSCCPGMSTSRRAGTSKSPPFPAPTPGGVSPQHTWLLQGPPRASREHGTESRRASPAQPDVLQKTTIGAKEQSGFTRATPRSDSILPVLPAQPVRPCPTGSLVPRQLLNPFAPQGTILLSRSSALASPQRITCPLCAATAARHSWHCRRAPREATGSAGRCQAAWARRTMHPTHLHPPRSRWGSPLTTASM